MTKYEKYEEVKKSIQAKGGKVTPYKEINYGIQFEVSDQMETGKVRIYESKKKGVTLDLSQIKNEALKNNLFSDNTNKEIVNRSDNAYKSDEWESELIGVDESGKGDCFGPLVVGAVYADAATKEQLMKIGVADSKKLSDKQIKQMAEKIKEVCQYEVLIISNETYNELYNKIQNLNVLLAKGHAKVIETLAKKTDAKLALSDQFGNEQLILEQLKKKVLSIELEQRPYAEGNVVVAAASILARDAFVTEIEKMSILYGQVFPKGAGPKTLEAGKKYVKVVGKHQLHKVAKLHFKTTQSL